MRWSAAPKEGQCSFSNLGFCRAGYSALVTTKRWGSEEHQREKKRRGGGVEGTRQRKDLLRKKKEKKKREMEVRIHFFPSPCR